jgi:hypothetical protein
MKYNVEQRKDMAARGLSLAKCGEYFIQTMKVVRRL